MRIGGRLVFSISQKVPAQTQYVDISCMLYKVIGVRYTQRDTSIVVRLGCYRSTENFLSNYRLNLIKFREKRMNE